MAPAAPDSSEWRFPNRVTPLGSGWYYAVRFCAPRQRERNALLLAWYRVIFDIAEQAKDPGVARLKLDWWRDELTRVWRQQARHPLALELQTLGLGTHSKPHMDALIDAAEAQLRAPTPIDEAAFAAACRGGFGRFFMLIAAVEKGQADPLSCVELGGYCVAVDRVRHLAQTPQHLPRSFQPGAVSRLTPEQRREAFDRLLRTFEQPSADELPALPELSRRLTALSTAMQRKMQRKAYPVTESFVDRAPIAKLWTAWRCA